MKRTVVWRLQRACASWQESVSYARVFGYHLEVAKVRGGRTVATIERKRKEDGGYDTIARRSWDNQKDGTLVTAREWSEETAARATTAAQ